MGSHRRPKAHDDSYEHSRTLTKASALAAPEAFAAPEGARPWTRRYPAITAAALAGTMVGGPGGVAAAMAFSGTHATADAPANISVTATSVPSVVALPSQSASASPSASASASARTSASPSASASASAKPSASPTPTNTAPVNPYAHTTLAELEPTALYGSQTTFVASTTQWQNARIIVQVAEQRKMPLYAAVIAIATALQESQLTNLTTATNADSLGLFQQRPSQGWGTASQITDPYYSTNAFLAALLVYSPHYMTVYLWESAQAVQRSGYPTAYAQWESQAAQMVLAIVNGTAP